MNSDGNSLIYRRYGFLHARILLRKQIELRTIERASDAEPSRLSEVGSDKEVSAIKSERLNSKRYR